MSGCHRLLCPANRTGVDGSARIADFARQIAAKNGLAAEGGGPVTVATGRVEALEELPGGGGRADMLVSEWMGYALLFESMLDSVLHARDRCGLWRRVCAPRRQS